VHVVPERSTVGDLAQALADWFAGRGASGKENEV